VKKLVQENRLLRCGYSPVDIPQSVNGAREVPHSDGVGCGRPARWSLVESSDARRHIATVCCRFLLYSFSIIAFYLARDILILTHCMFAQSDRGWNLLSILRDIIAV